MKNIFTIIHCIWDKYIKSKICIFLIISTVLIPTTTTASTLELLQALLVQNGINLSQMFYQAWSEGARNSVRAIEFTVSKANDIAITLSYANVQQKAKQYKNVSFKLIYAEDDLASATMRMNEARKNLKKSMNIESPEFASNRMDQEKYKSTLYLYDKALRTREKELKSLKRAKFNFDTAIDHFLKIQKTTEQRT
jgi:hypothetical protein